MSNVSGFKTKTIFAKFTVVAIFALLSSQALADETIKIGVLAPFHAVAGEGQIEASKLAVEEINDRGGINGKKIELILADTELNAEKAIAALSKLAVSDKVVAAAGIYSSGVTAAIQPYLSRFKLPFIGTASASPTLTENVSKDYEKFKYYFRLMNHAHRENAFVLSFIEDVLVKDHGIQKYAIISEQAKWAEDFIPWMEKRLKDRGLEVVYTTYFDIHTKDYSPIFNRIKSSGAEFIISNIAIAPGEAISKAWYEAKSAPMGGANVSAMRSDYWEKTQRQCLTESTYILGGFNIPISSRTQPFWEKYKERYGRTPEYAAFYTYDAIYILADSIGRATSLKGDDIVKAIETVKITGATGLIEWDKSHDPIEGEGRPKPYMLQWQEQGIPKIIYPKDISTGNFMFPSWFSKK